MSAKLAIGSLITFGMRDGQPTHERSEFASLGAANNIENTGNGTRPLIEFWIVRDEWEEGQSRDAASFQLVGYDKIDELRRYCEMTLAHFDKGIL